MSLRVLAIIVFCVSSATAAAATDGAHLKLNAGADSLLFPFFSDGKLREIRLWYYRPAQAGANAPIVFVLHGASRAAQNYRKYWIPEAERYGFILLVPEFSREQFPGSSYERGNVTRRDGSWLPESQWAYAAIEDIFDGVRTANDLTAQTYNLYGHSAGAQFVHRMVLFKPSARYKIAVAANAGWYCLPDFRVSFPYGLGGSAIEPDQLKRVLARRLVVLLGDRDIDPEHYQLRRTPEAMQQGNNRFERGHTFYEAARRAAVALGATFGWSLEVVPGVAHSNAKMAPAAAKIVGSQP